MEFFKTVIFLADKFSASFFKGTMMTLAISIIGTLLGFLIGFLVGIVQSAPSNKDKITLKTILLQVIKAICGLYVFLFRGTPMIVQAMVVYYGSLQGLGINLSPFTAGVIVVSLITGAYMSENVRGGILSIETGQIEGAKALGMTHFTTMISVVLPQVFRNLIPQMCNMYIGNIKDTSVLNIISITELFFVARSIAGTYYTYFEAFTIIAIIYLLLTTIFNALFKLLENALKGKDNYQLAMEYMDDGKTA